MQLLIALNSTYKAYSHAHHIRPPTHLQRGRPPAEPRHLGPAFLVALKDGAVQLIHRLCKALLILIIPLVTPQKPVFAQQVDEVVRGQENGGRDILLVMALKGGDRG